ncbi:MAG: hypothetical protein DRG69_09155, partial [Deltaproteobacteria bacterium]
MRIVGSSVWKGNPLFEGSSFSIEDYILNPQLGSLRDFKLLVKKAHKLGLKVIVDFIPNHLGVENNLLDTHPEFFIYRFLTKEEENLPDEEILKRNFDCFLFYNSKGQRILIWHGKDSNFGSWKDTAQLDTTNPSAREYAVDVLKRIASWGVDGVRCDMASLQLREVFKNTWNKDNPVQYWQRIIKEVKATYPEFIFIAESYAPYEGILQNLGFDYTYDKYPLDLLKQAFQSWRRKDYLSYINNLKELKSYIRRVPISYLKKSLHFLENHDEERSLNVFGEEKIFNLFTLLKLLPGVFLSYQGQFEGYFTRTSAVYLKEFKEEFKEGVYKKYECLLKNLKDLSPVQGLYLIENLPPEVMGFVRIYENISSIVFINLSSHPQEIRINIANLCINEKIKGNDFRVYTINSHLKNIKNYLLKIYRSTLIGIFSILILTSVLSAQFCYHLLPTPPNQIRIGTFNIEKLGRSNPYQAKNAAVILKNYDLIAVQEVMNYGSSKENPYGKKGIEALEKIVEYLGKDYTYVVSFPPKGTYKAEKNKAFSTFEYYAFIYNKSKLQLIKAYLWDEEVHPLKELENQERQFDREPFIASFSTKEGKLDFTIISVHVASPKQKHRPAEIKRLSFVYNTIQEENPYQNDVILLGDFNTPSDTKEWDWLTRNSSLKCIVSINTPTTINKRKGTLSKNQYDNICYQPKFTEEDVVRGSECVHCAWEKITPSQDKKKERYNS